LTLKLHVVADLTLWLYRLMSISRFDH